MKVVELDRGGGMLVHAIREQRAHEAARTGVHVSTIINDILRRQDPKRYAQEIREDVTLSFQETGNVIEDIIARGLAARIPGWTKPLPRTYRGIIGSPDGHSPRAQCIDEIKACWSKMRDFVQVDASGEVTGESLKFIGYKMQMLFYMLPFDCVRGRLHVLFITGDHHPPFPEARTYRLLPTKREKQTNFELIYTHGQDMGLL